MTTITGNSALDQLAATRTAANSRGTLDQNAFLKLMTTQLKTQDPFDPVDNTQMVAQMAQFSSVAGISEMNTSLKQISADIASSRIGDAASWIGRSALVEADVATPMAGGGYAGEIVLPENANSVNSCNRMNATDSFGSAAGTSLRTGTSGRTDAGTRSD